MSKRLWRLRTLATNTWCADCDATAPSHASPSQGVFLCAACATIHRQMPVLCVEAEGGGPLSVTELEAWTAERVRRLEERGNKRINGDLERFLPLDISKPGPEATTERRQDWITRKYIREMFTEPPEAEFLDESARQQMLLRARDLVSQMPNRLVDYFAVYGRGDESSRKHQPGNAAKETVAAGLDTLDFVPALCDRYPLDNWSDCAFDQASVAMFVCPDGLRLSRDSKSERVPVCYRFVMTSVKGMRQYGVVLKFWEKVPSADLSIMAECMVDGDRNSAAAAASAGKALDKKAQKARDKAIKALVKTSYYSPKFLVLLSHWEFCKELEECLKGLYRISLSSPPIPIERFVQNIVYEVPVPPQGVTRVQVTVADAAITIERPAPTEFPGVNASFVMLFRVLSHKSIVQLFTALASEKKVMIVGKNWPLVWHVAEASLALLFPFQWQGVYMPMLPRMLCDYLEAPVPFVAGVLHSYFEDSDPLDWPPADVVVCNIEEDSVSAAPEAALLELPTKVQARLMAHLKKFAHMFSPTADPVKKIELAYPNNENLHPVTRFSTEGGIRMDALPRARKNGSLIAIQQASHGASTRDAAPGKEKKGLTLRGAFAKARSGKHARPLRLAVTDVRFSFMRVWQKMLARYRIYLVRLRQAASDESDAIEVDSSSTELSSDDELAAIISDVMASSSRVPDEKKSTVGSPPKTKGSLTSVAGFVRRQAKSSGSQGNSVSVVSNSHAVRRTRSKGATVTHDNTDLRADGRPVDLFDVGRFIRDATDDQRPFLSEFCETQMFSRFIEDAWTADGQHLGEGGAASVRFFDEHLVAKRNRSKVRRVVKPQATPFLSQTKFVLKSTFVAPPPNVGGLVQSKRWHYENGWPKFDDSLFGAARFVQPLIEGGESHRRELANAVSKTQNKGDRGAGMSREHRLVASIQARARGGRVRRAERARMKTEVIDSLRALLPLWSKHNAALLQRSKFFVVFEAPTYLNVAVQQDEVKRLRAMDSSGVPQPKGFDRTAEERRAIFERLATMSGESVEKLCTVFGVKKVTAKGKPLKKATREKLSKSVWGPVADVPKDGAALLRYCQESAQLCMLSIRTGVGSGDNGVELLRDARVMNNLNLTVASALLSLRKCRDALQDSRAEVRALKG